MAYDSNLVRLIYLLTFFAEGAVLWVLVRRGLHRVVPWVTTFVVYVMARDLIVFSLYEGADHARFFKVSWVLEIGSTILITIFLIEIFNQALAEYSVARKIGWNMLIVSAVGLIVISTTIVVVGPPHSGFVARFIMVTERSVRIVHVGLIVTFFCFARYLALHLKQYQFGILLGYGLYAAANLAVAALNIEMGAGVGYKTMLIDSFTYIGMYLVWLSYLLKTEPSVPAGTPPISGNDLESWNQVLSHLKKR